jgi:hypothetical protein
MCHKKLVKKIETDLPALRFYNVLKIVQEYNERARKVISFSAENLISR